MASWLIQAIRVLTTLGAGAAIGEALNGGGRGSVIPLVPDVLERAVGLHPAQPDQKRRRRRRALTASDRADIAFVAGMISKAAAKDFAVQLAARPR